MEVLINRDRGEARKSDNKTYSSVEYILEGGYPNFGKKYS